MEEDKWSSYFSASARNHRSVPTIKYQYDTEAEDEMAVDYPCPFCSEDYDLVELCHHMDEEHSSETEYGICPVCVSRVKMNMVDHIISQHTDLFKSDHNRQKDGSYLPLSPRTNKYLQSLLEESPHLNHAARSVPADPFLSFIYNQPSSLIKPQLGQQSASSSAEGSLESKSSFNKDMAEKDGKLLLSSMSDTEQKEKTKRCEFVQELLASAIIDDSDL